MATPDTFTLVEMYRIYRRSKKANRHFDGVDTVNVQVGDKTQLVLSRFSFTQENRQVSMRFDVADLLRDQAKDDTEYSTYTMRFFITTTQIRADNVRINGEVVDGDTSTTIGFDDACRGKALPSLIPSRNTYYSGWLDYEYTNYALAAHLLSSAMCSDDEIALANL